MRGLNNIVTFKFNNRSIHSNIINNIFLKMKLLYCITKTVTTHASMTSSKIYNL